MLVNMPLPIGLEVSRTHLEGNWTLTSGLTQLLACESPAAHIAPLGHGAAWFFRWRT